MSDTFNSNLLMDDYPLMVLPKLAVAIGLEEAIVTQQLHWLLNNPKNGRHVKGDRWIFNTYEEWASNFFPFWSAMTVRRIFERLESMSIVISCQPEAGISRRKYYRLNHGIVSLMQKGKLAKPKRKSRWDGHQKKGSTSDQVDQIDGSTRSLPNTETTFIDYVPSSTSSKKMKSVKGGLTPTRGSQETSKEERIPKHRYPQTEEELIAALEANCVEYSPDYDGNFFWQMHRNNWCINGEPVWDWIATYQARLEHASGS